MAPRRPVRTRHGRIRRVTGKRTAGRTPEGRDRPLCASSVLAVGDPDRVALFDLFLGLVTRTGTAGRTNRAADDRARRPGHRGTNGRAGDAAGERATAGAGLVVALGRL